MQQHCTNEVDKLHSAVDQNANSEESSLMNYENMK